MLVSSDELRPNRFYVFFLKSGASHDSKNALVGEFLSRAVQHDVSLITMKDEKGGVLHLNESRIDSICALNVIPEKHIPPFNLVMH